jgi:hypothetical protein
MDEEGLRLDIAEALGKATAIICIQTALVTTLQVKGVLTADDVGSLSGVANETFGSYVVANTKPEQDRI